MAKRDENDERFKSKMNAWLMIQVIGQTSVNIFNSRKLAKEMSQYLETLTYGENPDEFAEYFIDTCISSRSYKSTLFGVLPMSDDGVGIRLAQDINQVTKVVPERFGYREECKTLNEAFWKAFNAKFEDAQEIIKEAGL